MGRPGTINYRKIVMSEYAPICVYCGFEVRAVLEVAHLDGNAANCELANLALLCPTCHRMHDVDLIPTEVIIRLRDEKRAVRWAKLTKDAAKKAVETKRRDPTALGEAARKAAATRRARKAGTQG